MNNPRRSTPFGTLLTTAVTMTLLLWAAPLPAVQTDLECSDALSKWEQVMESLKGTVSDYRGVKRTPVSKIIDHPIVERRSEKTIAKQVSEALNIKERRLEDRRKQCRNLMALEREAFAAVSTCMQESGKSTRRKLKKLARERERAIKRSLITISEVCEVRGVEQPGYYAENLTNQQVGAGRTIPNSYWQRYQQMYQSWWGR